MKHETPANFTATIDRREGRYFVLSFSDGQTLNVPIHFFSRQAREGDVIHLKFYTDQQARATKAELARGILEEILGGE